MTFFEIANHPLQYGMSLGIEELKSLVKMIESSNLTERRVFNSLKEQIKKELNEKKFI